MTRLEDALREAFTSDVDATAPQMLQDVRLGARRRRTARRATAAVVAAVAVVAGIAVGGALAGQESRGPSPAPRPTETVTDGLPGEAMQIEATGDRLFATTAENDCGCSAFWRYDDAGWHRVHDFSEEYVERLAMAPDGETGWATSPGGPIWVTHDGGQTWEQAGLKGLSRGQHSFVLAATGDTRWPAWAVDVIGGTMWRFNGDYFEQVSYDEVGAARDVVRVGEALVVTPQPVGEGSVITVPKVTRDGGATWGDLPFPCEGENALIPAETAVFVLCPAGQQGATLHRSTDLIDWQQYGASQGVVTDTVCFDGDTVLMRGRKEMLVTGSGATEIDTGLGPDDSIWDAARFGDAVYLATTAGVLVSEDGGVTWDAAR